MGRLPGPAGLRPQTQLWAEGRVWGLGHWLVWLGRHQLELREGLSLPDLSSPGGGARQEFREVAPITDVRAQHTEGLHPRDTRPDLGAGRRLLVSGHKGPRREGAVLPARGARPPTINHHARLYNYLGT